MNSPLPAINAALNGCATVLLVCGLLAIKRKRVEVHVRFMLAAFVVSSAFLASYLYYHFAVAKGAPTSYHGQGAARAAYLTLLISHSLLAVVNLPMVLRTLYLAWRQRWDAHRRLARWTFPIWLYVSATGVLVYLVLYHWNPDPGVRIQ